VSNSITPDQRGAKTSPTSSQGCRTALSNHSGTAEKSSAIVRVDVRVEDYWTEKSRKQVPQATDMGIRLVKQLPKSLLILCCKYISNDVILCS
jgi:hypothetical protein